MMRFCDKCGKEVDKDNSVRELEYEVAILRVGPAVAALRDLSARADWDRHLFPEGECVGSPSRAQYLGGKPDTRYPLFSDLTPLYRKARANALQRVEAG